MLLQAENAQNIFYSNWSKLLFWLKIVVILSIAQFITTVNFISASDKSCVEWDNSSNSTQKIRIYILCGNFSKSTFFTYYLTSTLNRCCTRGIYTIVCQNCHILARSLTIFLYNYFKMLTYICKLFVCFMGMSGSA